MGVRSDDGRGDRQALREVARGQRVAVGGVVQRDAVAVLELHRTGADLGGLAVHEHLPVMAGGLVPAEDLAGVGGRDRVEVPAVVAFAVVGGEAGLPEGALEQVRGRGAGVDLEGVVAVPDSVRTVGARPDDRGRDGDLLLLSPRIDCIFINVYKFTVFIKYFSVNYSCCTVFTHHSENHMPINVFV